MPEWTKAQRDAIDARHCHLLVAAAAGSGKTAVLVERILTLVREGESLERMLVVTFTRAATAEMRGRILAALQAAAEEGAAHLIGQALRIERASIYTLDGFCTEVVRQHFQEVGIDPAFRVADNAEADALRTQAMDEALIAAYEQPSEAFADLTECLTPEEIADWAFYLYKFIMARPDPWTWLDESIAQLDLTAAQLPTTPWMKAVLRFAALGARGAADAFRRLASLCAHEPGLISCEETALKDVEMAETIAMAADSGYEALRDVAKLSHARKPSKRPGADQALDKLFDDDRNRAKDQLKEAIDATFLFRPLEEHARDLRDSRLLLIGIFDLLRGFQAAYSAAKRERNLLDFHDLEHFALKALRAPSVSTYYRQKYNHVFVDEYQDSSPLQEAILQCFVREDNLFLVGDVKQSIYRFRLADPGMFLRKYEMFGTEPGEMTRRIDLNANFRSQPVILHGVNELFRQIMRADVTEIDYDDRAALSPGLAEGPSQPPITLHIVAGDLPDSTDLDAAEQADAVGEALPEDADAEETAPVSEASIAYEAETIARDIHMLMAESADGALEKPIRFRDIVILLRATTGRVAAMLEVLRRHGIPAWSDGGETYFEQLEVQQVVDLLHVIDNPLQDLPLLSALRGPSLGLTDEDLAQIRIAHPDGFFHEAATECATKDDDLGQALRDWLVQVERWRFCARIQPMHALLQMLYQETNVYAQVGALPGGQVRQINLRMLADRAAAFDRQQTGGLSGFLRYLARIRQGEQLSAHELGESDDVVRIMSIHKSKGLQFPVVFVAGLGTKFHLGVKKSPLLAHSTLGLGAMAYDRELSARCQTIARKAIALQSYQEQLAEETRILYVAMTRAERHLILVGSVANLERTCLRWSAPLTSAAVYGAKNMLDWIGPCVMAHPDAGLLREVVQTDVPFVETQSRWLVSLHAKERTEVLFAKEIEASLEAFDVDEAALRATLAWQAPYAVDAPVKQSVSELVRNTPREVPWITSLEKRPQFMLKKGMTGAERGTAMHTLLGAIDLRALRDVETSDDLLHEIDHQRVLAREHGILTQEQYGVVSPHAVATFFESELGKRIRRAEVVRREWPFNLRIDRADQRALVQGIIDCCFLEDGEWVLVDYKTDSAKDVEAITAHYTPQLQYYGDALTRITGHPVREKYLYLLSRQQEYLIV